MHDLGRHSQPALLCFSRWSRSKAAVFRSLSQHVVIGHLKASVLARLERKTSLLRSACATDVSAEQETQYSEPDDTPQPIYNLPLEAYKAWMPIALSAEPCGVGLVHLDLQLKHQS